MAQSTKRTSFVAGSTIGIKLICLFLNSSVAYAFISAAAYFYLKSFFYPLGLTYRITDSFRKT
jgi:hypothetical protein